LGIFIGFVQGNQGAILQRLQGGVSVKLLLNLFPQIKDGKAHQAEGLNLLGAKPEALFLCLREGRSLKLQINLDISARFKEELRALIKAERGPAIFN
jgi:hypothetical protein